MLVLVEPVTVAAKGSECETITVVEGITVTVTTFELLLPPQPASARRARALRLGHRDALVLRDFVNTITPNSHGGRSLAPLEISNLPPGFGPALRNRIPELQIH